MRGEQEIEELRGRIAAVPHWYHRFDFGDGLTTPGISHGAALLARLRLPERLDGMRVLDLGARDGYVAFACEQRGASEVVAIDYAPRGATGFDVAADALGCTRVQYVEANLYRLPSDLGEFDLVLFLGLLYHLPDPLGALSIVRAHTRGAAYVETHVIDEAMVMPDGSFASLPAALMDVPLMQFYPRGALYGEATNFWAPNSTALAAMLDDVGFAVEWLDCYGQRAVARCIAAENPKAAFHHALARGERAMPGA